MTFSLRISQIAVFAFVITGFLFTGKVWADGKQLFLDNKCNKCHEGAGITKLPKEAGDEAEAEDAEEEGKKVDPTKIDEIKAELLKDHGTPEAAKAFVPAYLAKEQANKDGRKHKKKFKGTKEEATTIADWLLSL